MECPAIRIGQPDPERAALFLLGSGACTLLQTSCWRPALGRVGCSTAVSVTMDHSLIPALQAKARLLAWEGVLCWRLDLLPCVLRPCPGTCTHLPQRPAHLLASRIPHCAGGDSLLPLQSDSQPCLYATCPPPQHPGFPSPGLLQLTSSSRRKQACRLWCLSTNLSPTSLCAGPRLLRCVASFFPMAAAAGLWPDVGITCFGSCLWRYSQGCQHTSPLPSFSDAKVFSLIDVIFL